MSLARPGFERRVAVVAGSEKRMGRQTTLDLAPDIATVVAVDVDRLGVAQTVDKVGVHGGKAEASFCDVSDRTQIRFSGTEASYSGGDTSAPSGNSAEHVLAHEFSGIISSWLHQRRLLHGLAWTAAATRHLKSL